jgi:hypothetical protein
LTVRANLMMAPNIAMYGWTVVDDAGFRLSFFRVAM